MNDWQSEAVHIKGKELLAGTLTFPVGADEVRPGVLFIGGTGDVDRDGNANKGKIKLNIYRELAHFVSSLGFVTLRYDKRGVGKSAGKTYETGMWDLVNDARTALQFLRNDPRVDGEKIFVIGHSEGTIIATALERSERVAGLVLLSGAGSTLIEAISAQQVALSEELRGLPGFKGFLLRSLRIPEKLKKKHDALLKKMMTTKKDIVRMNFVRFSSKWFREHNAYDLFGDYEKITCPVLAITGKKDVQANYKALEKLPTYMTCPLETYAIATMNHSLKEESLQPSILQAKQQLKQNIGKPLHPELTELLVIWFRKFM